MRRILATVFSLFLLAVTETEAERYYYFDHLDMTDGLFSNTIYCSHQDSNGFVWIGTRDGLCRYDGNSFTRLSELVSGYESSGSVFAITEDNGGRIWFSTSSDILYYDPDTNRLSNIGKPGERPCFNMESDMNGNVWIASDHLLRHNTIDGGRHTYTFDTPVTSIAMDSYGAIWITLEDGKLLSYDKLSDSFTTVSWGYRLEKIANAEDGMMLALTDDRQVLYFDCATLNSKVVFRSEAEVRCLLERTKGECWIGTAKGLFIRRYNEEYIGEAFHDDATPESISADFITCLDKDNEGNIWAGTYYTGMNLWQNKGNELARYFTNPSDNALKGKIVRSIVQDSKGCIWLCTEDGWLNRFNAEDHSIRNYLLDDNLNLQGLVIDGDRMWVCSYGNGAYLFDLNAERTIRHYDVGNNQTVTGIITSGGELLVGTSNGLYRLDRENDRFVHDPICGKHFVHSFLQDSSGALWIGTFGDGIRCLNAKGVEIDHITTKKDGRGLSSDFITSMFEDSRHRIWITTEGGGVCYAEPGQLIENVRFRKIGTKEGLPSNVTCAVAEDSDGVIWVSTINGITSLSHEKSHILGIFNERDDLKGYHFSYGAVCSTRSGILYFGNTEGFISFIPARIKTVDSIKRNLVITDIKARNSGKSITLHEKGKSVICTENVEVKHMDASSISISYAIPDFSSRKPLYAFEVMRGKREWASGTTYDHQVTFKLKPGRYTFRFGIMGKEEAPEYLKTLKVRILPHPMASGIAISIYILIFLILVGGLITSLEQRRKSERARQISKLVNSKEKELYNAKINYFTNITHEIRTPLTLIKMPLDKLIAKGAYTPESEKDLRTIQANADRLLSLTNQLLDMRKMEQNEIKLSCTKEDICGIVRKTARYFEQTALDQHITLTTYIPEKPVYLMCAKDSIVTIVSNLLSNAVKYGKDRIDVKVSASEDGETISVRVESNGDHIPDNDKERIFNIFFQREANEANGRISQGTGLGLPYARTLANMHNGKLYLDMNVLEMNSFVLELPVHQENQIAEEPVKVAEKHVKDPGGFDSSKHTILVVEDSEEMRDYIADDLSDTYNILTAANGSDALGILKNEKVDLVVSDIMMPIMDGCELCNHIKTDSDLSHVPVILLTAAIGVETRIETLEIGADGYIEKPFPIELLRSNISNLFRNKEISYKQFINKPLTHYNSVTASKVDEEYMSKLHDYIMKHISETDLNIENLTTQLGTSKSSLYRKLKANTGLSINEYIRVCRLKQAAELLSTQKYKINEVAFMTGFSSPSYFATCFQKQFNLSPSEFVKNLGQ